MGEIPVPQLHPLRLRSAAHTFQSCIGVLVDSRRHAENTFRGESHVATKAIANPLQTRNLCRNATSIPSTKCEEFRACADSFETSTPDVVTNRRFADNPTRTQSYDKNCMTGCVCAVRGARAVHGRMAGLRSHHRLSTKKNATITGL